jgi:phospholipase/lecithinase/hemolysin/uncharacterized protein YhjY with autotransporter beta-barrel domain
MKRLAILSLCTLIVGRGLPGVAEASDRYVFLGDSLTDNQNSYLFTDRLNEAGLGLAVTPRSPPYWHGRFSNGANWSDIVAPNQVYYADYYMSDAQCLSENATVAGSGVCQSDDDPGPGAGSSLSFAFGGSKSGTETLLDAPGFLTVLDDLAAYEASGRIADLSDAVFSIWTGGNDYSNYVTSTGGLSRGQIVAQTLDNIETGLRKIAALGARRAVVFNIFDLDKIPTFVADLGASGAATAETLATRHNAALPTRLDSVRADTGLDIVLVDVDAMYDDIFQNPSRYGFTNLTEGCIDETTLTETGACSDAESAAATLYFDGTHPTTAAHGYIAELFEATIQAVDEDGGRMAALADSGLVHADQLMGAVRRQIDDWRIDSASGDPLEAAANPLATTIHDLSLYAVATNTLGTRTAKGDFAGYEYDSQGFIFGADYRPSTWGPPVVLGVTLGTATLDSSIHGGGAFDNQTYQVGLFAGLRRGALTLTAQYAAMYMTLDDISRDTSFSVLPTARSDTHGWAHTGELEARYDIDASLLGQDLRIVPLARLSATRVDVDAFSERDAEFLNLSIDDSALDRVRSGLGLNLWSHIATKGGVLTPHATVAWEHNLVSPTWAVDGSLPSSQALSASTRAGGQDAVALDLGLVYRMDNGIELSGSVSSTLEGGGSNSIVIPRLGFRMTF